jgi:hypothetical protein
MIEFISGHKEEASKWLTRRMNDAPEWTKPVGWDEARTFEQNESFGRLLWIRTLFLIDPKFRDIVESTSDLEPFVDEIGRNQLNFATTSLLPLLEMILIIYITEWGTKRNGPNIASFTIGATVEYGWKPGKDIKVNFKLNNETDVAAIQGWFWQSTLEMTLEKVVRDKVLRSTWVTFMTVGLPRSEIYYTAIAYRLLRKHAIDVKWPNYDDSPSLMAANRARRANEELGEWRISEIYATQYGLGNPYWFGSFRNKGVAAKPLSYKPVNWNGVSLLDKFETGVDRLSDLELDITGVITGIGKNAPPLSVFEKYFWGEFEKRHKWSPSSTSNRPSWLSATTASSLNLMIAKARLAYGSDKPIPGFVDNEDQEIAISINFQPF